MTPNTDALPERDHTKPAEQQGLFRKFVVTRTDGSSEPGGKHEHCEYFVLDTDHDPHAAAALAAYADAVEAKHPELAADLRQRYALAQRQQVPAITDAMVDAYLQANDAYWREVDALPTDITKPWRQGTPKEATRVSLAAALTAATQAAEPVARVVKDGASVRLEWASVEAAHNAPVGPLFAPTAARQPPIPPVDHGPVILAPAAQQRPALVTALQGLLASLSRAPTEFELRAAAHEFTVMADRAAAAARAGGDHA